MIALKRAYASYLETQVDGSEFQRDLSTNKYLCWSIPHQQDYTVHNWLGKYMGTGIIQSRRYVWLGNKGAVYVTCSPKFEKKHVSDSNIELDMRKWVWKKYFNIDL